MRLGKEQAVGYVEDTEENSPAVEGIKVDSSQPLATAPDPVTVSG
jgi:hypothetical protein